MNLKELVVCKFDGCNQVFNDPRILPCGKRTCAAHIEEMTMKHDGTSSDRKIKCHFCHKIHVCSDKAGEGFLVDENISLLLNMKYCHEHEAAKKSFNELTQLLAKLTKLHKEDYVLDYFERVEADILVEKEVNMQKLAAHYQKLVDELHERKGRCLDHLKRNETPDSELKPINQALKEFDTKLKKDNLDFILKTVDGDQVKWKTIESECNAMMEKVKSLEEQLNEIVLGDEMIGLRPSESSTQVEDICGRLDFRDLDSLIISSFKMENDLLELCQLSDIEYDFGLLYRASRDGFEAAAFHAKCDNQPNTLTIIKTTSGYIFGGYTAAAWDSTSGYKADPDAFIFSLVNASADPQLIPIIDDENEEAIYCHAEHGPMFGGGHDIDIWSNSNTSMESYSELGRSYDFSLFDSGTFRAQSFLAGSRNFQTLEIEVFVCK